MRILHVIHRYAPAIGGSETWCAGLAHWQVAHGHTVTVLTHRAVEEAELWTRAPAPSCIALGTDDRIAGVRVHRVPVEHPTPIFTRLLGRFGLWAWTGALSSPLAGFAYALAREHDVVHAHTIPLAHA